MAEGSLKLESFPGRKVPVHIRYFKSGFPSPDSPHNMFGNFRSLWDILWTLLHDKSPYVHLTLDQNPHFYSEDLDFPEAQDPIPFDAKLEDLSYGDNIKIHVLTDRNNRIFVKT